MPWTYFPPLSWERNTNVYVKRKKKPTSLSYNKSIYKEYCTLCITYKNKNETSPL